TADPLAVVFVPSTETSTRSTQQSIASNSFVASFQKTTSEGAYTTIGPDTNSLISLSTGKVVDVSGNGEYAIGRWTDGSSTILGSINSNQGAHYVVGKPLALNADFSGAPTVKANCSAIAATSPTASSGNFAPGKLNSATGVIGITFPGIETLTLDVAVGSDAHATATITGTLLYGVGSASGVLYHVQALGSNPKNPLVALGYSMPTPTSGDVSGVVVLKCTSQTGPV
uniref:hypothetical protein n=1 Tax=Cupriavidus sp. WS TaxID=1312922 RepID=UPI0003634435